MVASSVKNQLRTIAKLIAAGAKGSNHNPMFGDSLDFEGSYLVIITRMLYFTTQQAAKKLGIGLSTLIRYIVEKNVPAPNSTKIGKREVRAWTEDDIQRVREVLPKIENGRKTRYQKQRKRTKRTKP